MMDDIYIGKTDILHHYNVRGFPGKNSKKYNESGEKTGLRTISVEQPAIFPPHLFFRYVRRSLFLSLFNFLQKWFLHTGSLSLPS